MRGEAAIPHPLRLAASAVLTLYWKNTGGLESIVHPAATSLTNKQRDSNGLRHVNVLLRLQKISRCGSLALPSRRCMSGSSSTEFREFIAWVSLQTYVHRGKKKRNKRKAHCSYCGSVFGDAKINIHAHEIYMRAVRVFIWRQVNGTEGSQKHCSVWGKKSEA